MLTKSKGGDAPKTDECRIEKPITEVDELTVGMEGYMVAEP